METPRVTYLGLSLLAVLWWLSSPVAADGVYRWTDANGQVQYGARPPPDAEAQRMELRDTTPVAPGADDLSVQRRDRQQRMLESFQYERERKRTDAAQDRARRERSAQQCRQLKTHWRRLNHGGPVYYQGADGAREYLSDDRREAEKARARSAYIEACGEAP